MEHEEPIDLSDIIPFEKRLVHSTMEPIPEALSGQAIVVNVGTGYTVYAKVEKGGVFFRFSEVSFTKQSVECVMEIELKVDGYHPPFSQRIDLRSSSARKGLSTDLNAAYGDKKAGFNWVLILNNAFNQVMATIQSEQQPISVENNSYQELPFLLSPFLQEGVANLIFSTSEVGKTWFALRLAISLATGQSFLGYPSVEGKKTLFLDYEDTVNVFTNRLYNLTSGMDLKFKDIAPNIHYYKPIGSFRTNTEQIKAMVAKGGYSLIIIDAGGDAAGGSPSDEEKVLDFFNALDEVKCTKLILHHEPKYVQSEAAAFYGSMYWKNRSRIGWRLQVENEEGSKKLIKASIQKRSNLPYIEPFYYTLNFDSLSIFEEHDPPVTLAVRMDRADISSMLKDKPLADAVVVALEKNNGLTLNQLADLTGRDKSRISRALGEKPLIDLVEKTPKGRGILWTLKNDSK